MPSGGRIRCVRLFSAITVFILLLACANFVNLSTAKAAGRIKEAGIRSVFGLACWMMNEWLNDFAYRASIGFNVFLLTLLSITLTTFITIGFQSLKSTTANLAKTLRAE